MDMTTTVDIDFEKLETCISELELLLPQLDEPSYESLEFWLSGTTGSGIVLEHLYRFCNNTIEFHNDVYALIDNTIKYLKEVRKIKDKDQLIANSL